MKNLLSQLKKVYKQIFSYPKTYINVGDVDYDDYWKDKRGKKIGAISSWQKKRACIVLQNIEKNNSISITDIGCGDGSVLKYIKERASVSKVTGVDVSSFSLERAKEFGIETIQADINNNKSLEKLPVSDYVLLFEVLEHIQSSEKFLNSMLERAQRGVFFSFPNTGFYVYRLRLLFGKFPAQWVVSPGEHVRFWTTRDLKWWLSAQGIKQYNIFYYEGVPILNKIIPSLFAAGFVVYIKK